MSDAWRDRAACKNMNPNLFFPPTKGGTDPSEALNVCRRCPVVDQCLAWALENRMDEGVLGGTTEAERLRLSGRRRRVHSATQR